MYWNLDTDLLWLRLLDKYLIIEYNLKSKKSDFCNFYRKDDKGGLELMISVLVDDIFMSGRPEIPKNTK